MRIFKTTTNNAMPYWILYEEPQTHLVQITDMRQTNHYFELAFPGIVILAESMKNQISASWPYVFAVNRCPITLSGNLSKRAVFNIMPLPHCYDHGGCCIYGKGPRKNMIELFTEFWQSKAKYFVEGQVASWVNENYPDMLSGNPKSTWTFFKTLEFFDDWEKKYNIDNIAKAPFFNLRTNLQQGSNMSGGHIANILANPWEEIDLETFATPEERMLLANVVL